MELLYQDSQIVLCVKPVGLSSESGPGSLPSLLEAQLGAAVYPVHRLDLNVGGVMVYARTRQAAAALSQAVQAGHLQKEYLALVHGRPIRPQAPGRICSGRTVGKIKCLWSVACGKASKPPVSPTGFWKPGRL